MAKKKTDPQAESNSSKSQDTAHDNEMDEPAPVKIKKLKSLNALLLRETVERRQQVDSLTKLNGHLKSELSRSEMDNSLLQSEINGVTEQAVMLEIEKGLVSVFVTGQVNQLAEEKVESLMERIGSLEGEMKRALEEKSEMEKSKSEKESVIMDLNRRVDELMAKVDEERRVSSRACDERDQVRAMLGAQIQEVDELQMKVREAEKNEAQNSEEVLELQANLDRLVQENKVNMQLNMQRIDSITSEKNLIQESFVEANEQINVLKKTVDTLLEQIKAIEDDKNTQVRKNEELEALLGGLKEFIEDMKSDEQEMQDKITDLKNKYAASSENEVALQNEIDEFVEEKKQTDEQIKSLENDKSSVLKDLEDAMKELELQKLRIAQIIQEKTELEDAKIQGESEIIKMKEQLTTLQDTISSLESSTINQNERLKQLEDEVSNYKVSLDQATIERDEALKTLQELEAIKTDFQHKITEMEKQIEDLHDLENKYATSSGNEVIMQKQIDDLVEEKKETDEHVKSLENEKSSVLKELQDAMKELEHQKHTIELIIQEKTELEDAKIQGENEIVKMKEELIVLQGTISSLESSTINQTEKVKQLEDEVSSYKASLDQATIEKDEALKTLQELEAMKTDLQHKITEMEKEIEDLHVFENKYATSSGNEVMMQKQIDGLIEVKKETYERIESLENEKSLVQKELQDAMKEIEHKKHTIEQIVQEKTELEDAKIQGESEIVKMKEQLIAFQDTISSLESSTINQSEKLKQLEEEVSHYKASLDQATIEKDELFKTLENEKSSVIKDLQDAMKEIEQQKLTIEKTVQEKTELEDAKIQGESEIAKMKEQLITFQDTISSLISSTINQNEKLKQLEEEVSHYKTSLDQATIEKDELFKSLEDEKSLVLKDLQDAMKEVEQQKHTIEQIVQEKSELEDAKIQGESEIAKMKEQLITFQDTISSLESSTINQNQKLQQLDEEISHYKASLDQATIEKDELVKSLDNDKSSVLNDLQDAMKEVEHQKLIIEQLVQEKAELQDAKFQGENEIVNMKDQLIAFQHTISSLESFKINQNEKLKQLEEQVSHYKASFDQATIERNKLLETLHEQEAAKTDFQHTITELEKKIKDLHEDLSRTTTESSKNLAEKNEVEARCATMEKNMADLEAKLEEARVQFDETKTKFGLAEANSNRVLNILKKTLSGSNENVMTRDFDLGNGYEEEIKDPATELEEIKRVFKEKDSKMEELKRKLEMVENSAAEVRKDKSFWTMVSSASTLVAAAAVSVAYVSRTS